MPELSDIIPFNEWKPDEQDYPSISATVATNVLTKGETYKPFPSLADFSDALGARALGGFSFTDPDGNVVTFAGTQTKLYKLSGVTWEDVTRTSGGDYSTAADGRWVFKNYGDRVLATNFVDDIQSFVVGSSTDFAQLAAAAPKCKTYDIVNNFVVTANTFDSTDGNKPERIWWSAIDDPTDWPVIGSADAASKQSDRQDIVGNGGANRAIIGSQNYAVIVQERNIWRMEYVGPPEVFTLTLAEENRGTKASGSVVADGRFVYYLGEDGFYVFDGTQSRPIGINRVDDFFNADMDTDNIHRINAAVNPLEHIVAWAYPGAGNIDGEPNKLIIYNWFDDRWTLVEESVEILFQALSAGLTLDQLDTVNTSLDALPYSLDSRAYTGGSSLFAGFSSNNKLAFFNGSNMAATIDTAEGRLNPQGRAFVESVLPMTDASGATVAIGTRDDQTTTVSFTGATSINSRTNEVPFRSDARFHRARVAIPAATVWNDAVGVRYRSQNSGVQ